VRTEADLVVAESVRLIRGSDVHAIRLDQRLGDRLSDPPVGTRLVPTAEPVVSLRVLYTPREERERGQGMIEGDALAIGGHTGTPLIGVEERLLKHRRANPVIITFPPVGNEADLIQSR
jgi:hypothetical protein